MSQSSSPVSFEWLGLHVSQVLVWVFVLLLVVIIVVWIFHDNIKEALTDRKYTHQGYRRDNNNFDAKVAQYHADKARGYHVTKPSGRPKRPRPAWRLWMWIGLIILIVFCAIGGLVN